MNINLNNTIIKQVKSIKILGYDLNANCSDTNYYNRVSKEVQNSINALEIITSLRGGLRPRTAINTFKNLIQSTRGFLINQNQNIF